MNRKPLPFRSIQNWSFIFLILFFVLSFIDRRFGILGLVCLAVPFVLALLGYGRLHCSHVCPRGSFFSKVVSRISVGHKLPPFFRSLEFRYGVMVFMAICLTGNVFRFYPDLVAMANGMFQVMTASFAVGTIFGIFFKPRSWCTFCPIGFSTGLIKEAQTQSAERKQKTTR
jgi:polyferredoxin